jgi:hypothetical protein
MMIPCVLFFVLVMIGLLDMSGGDQSGIGVALEVMELEG